jgi:hypothetical protein
LLEEWKQIFASAMQLCVKLEEARQEKRIGKGLEAEIEIAGSRRPTRPLAAMQICFKSLKSERDS